ncbi:hypothetical protein B0H11DRAFT_2188821 [Mycena galericulata]|nr:hypothetical protein B0H11DRAFT_2188821 [Mycena galericulata]
MSIDMFPHTRAHRAKGFCRCIAVAACSGNLCGSLRQSTLRHMFNRCQLQELSPETVWGCSPMVNKLFNIETCGGTHRFEGAGEHLNIATAAICGSLAADKHLQILCSGSLRQLQRHFLHFAAAVMLYAAAVMRQSAALLRSSAAVYVVTQRQCDMFAAMFNGAAATVCSMLQVFFMRRAYGVPLLYNQKNVPNGP